MFIFQSLTKYRDYFAIYGPAWPLTDWYYKCIIIKIVSFRPGPEVKLMLITFFMLNSTNQEINHKC